jgi:hypothetical protein
MQASLSEGGTKTIDWSDPTGIGAFRTVRFEVN